MRQHLGILSLFLSVVVFGACAEGTSDDQQAQAICGDNSCDGGETIGSCPQDCAGSEAICGDAVCNGSETINTCAEDCSGTQNPVCGDHVCNGTETLNSCPGDCGGNTASCGDGTCNGTDTSANCPVDCPAAGSCGDLVCDAGEDTSCPSDCAAATGCGDLVCDVAAGECESVDFNCTLDCIFDDQCGGGGGGGACDHDVCTAGGALLTSCDACSASVCAVDSFCCDTEWDATCVDEVATECAAGTCP